MLALLFLLAAAVLAASWFRPPTAFWQKAVTGLAAMLLVAVLVAWGIEWMMSASAE